VATSSGQREPPAHPRLRLAACDRRSQILAAALEVFAERGFHGTRTRELAERAGVSEALLFHHFPSKEAVIRAIFELMKLDERIRRMEERTRRMSPHEALVSLAEGFLTNLREEPGLFRVLFYGIMETPHLSGEFYDTFLSRLLEIETRLFERAFRERPPAMAGALPGAAVDARIVARSFHGSLLFYMLAVAVSRIESLPAEPRALAESVVNIYLPEDTP
jgi:AcrR family transcriptional regulator